MEKYTALDKSFKNPILKPITIIFGIFLAIFGAISFRGLSVAIGMFLIYLALYKKEIIADKNCITTHYNGLFFKKTISYHYTDFSGLTAECGNNPEIVLGFIRKSITTQITFTRKDGRRVIELAKDSNPNLSYIEVCPKRKSSFF